MKPTILTLMLLAAGTASAGSDLADWLDRHAPDARRAIAFTETRPSELVEGDLVTRGTLRFEPPDRLEKHIASPRPETQVITAESVTIRDDRTHRRRTFALERAPALVALRQALIGWLTADAAMLERHFETELSTGDDGWRLVLRPRSGHLAEELDSLELTGRGRQAVSMQTRLVNGDAITTRFEPGQ